MHRFFLGSPLSIDMILTDPEIVSQLTRVLRSSPGDHIVLFDGDGSESEYEIVSIEKKSLRLRGVSLRYPATESPLSITLSQALPNKIEKIEYIIQKGVEVGIQRFIFFRSDRSQKLVISDAKITRLHTIAREAVEQCGGVRLPTIVFAPSFTALMSEVKGSDMTHIVLDTLGPQRRLRDSIGLSAANVWVGPEGGWSDEERAQMISNGFIFAHFSERVLRTETAGVVVSFALLNL